MTKLTAPMTLAQKMLYKRGRCKHPEGIMNFSKACISIMFAGSASGQLLPPDVVYKAYHLWQSWTEAGTSWTRIGRTKSGWSDAQTLKDSLCRLGKAWRRAQSCNRRQSQFSSLILNCGNMRKDGHTVCIASCKLHTLSSATFRFSHLKKRNGDQYLENHKVKSPNSTGMDKTKFSRLQKRLFEEINAEANLKAGFKACVNAPMQKSSHVWI